MFDRRNNDGSVRALPHVRQRWAHQSMNERIEIRQSRRQWFRLNVGALLGLGLWPGCARFAGNGRGGAFRFVVINDTHFQSPRCPEWFGRVTASIHRHEPRPELCLVVGDLAEHGTREQLGAMRDVLGSIGIEFHAVIGNHDYTSATDRSAWDHLFPGSINYHFRHRGWRFIGLDSSDGTKWRDTAIQPATLSWLDAHLSKWNPADPTVLFTHFPLGGLVPTRPLNADDLLERFAGFNLVSVFNGHFHAFTERKAGSTTFTTNQCCAISRANHDRSKEKGYFLCTASEGRIERQFIEVTPA